MSNGMQMRWEKSIASRAALGFALVWAITALAIGAAAILAREASDALERTLIINADDLLHASQAQVTAERMVAVGRGYLLTRSTDLLSRAKEAEGDLDAALQALDRGDVQPPERALLRDVQRSADTYRRLLDEAFTSTAPRDDPRGWANALRERLLPAREDLGVTLGNLVAHKQRLQATTRQRAAAAATRSVRITLGLGALALILSALLARRFTRHLVDASRREQASALAATRALAARHELLGIVAHDLRNPLAAIALRASQLARDGSDPNTTRSATTIGAICSRMSHLIDSLLDAATIEAGRLSVSPERLGVEAFIRSLVDTFEPAARERSIHLLASVSPPDLVVWADRERLFQVLSNLTANALKFTPARGVVKVSARAARGAVGFEVSDTGAGIAIEHLPLVFERYWKSDVQSARGAGLGLYIAKGLVEAHRGRIWVDSTVGVGSSFQFELPTPSSHDVRREATALPATPIATALQQQPFDRKHSAHH